MTPTDTLAGGVAASDRRLTDDDVAAFAAAVRSHLDDLPADEVEDLVDGLEADLIERREDSDEPLGDPREYADELRSAAGLPPRRESADGEWFGGYRRLARNTSAWVREQRENPVVATVLDFLLALRPVWWVLRGWIAFALIVMFGALTPVPDSLLGWVVLASFVIVSVQWGRGSWLPWGWLRTAKTVVSIVVLVALPFTLGQMNRTIELAAYGDSGAMEGAEDGAISGLVNVNGDSVKNLFAFDCAGNPLSGVQIFDQDGEPLALDDYGPVDDWIFDVDDLGREVALVPNPNTTGGSGWNVFPLLQADFDEEYQPDLKTAEEPVPPFAAVQPLAEPNETCAPAGTQTETETQPGGDAAEPDTTDGAN